MGSLTTYLQREIPDLLPRGWACDIETRLLGNDLTQLLGYDPRVDVVLTHVGMGTRVWVEFEVSRADPVANHAKFATSHLYVPQGPADHFVAMLSPHIDRGRRNLAAATIRLMRRVGMSAFQTTLLPLATPEEVKRLNQLPVDALAAECLDVAAEVERALAVVTPVGRWGRLDVHLAGDLFDVFVNLRGWNEELRTADGRIAWGKRSCAYFVFDPATGQFAPSKFCAYTPISPAGDSTSVTSDSHRMTVSAYTALNDGTHVMDGNRAWQHLVRCLGMKTVTGNDTAPVTNQFAAWLADHGETITVRGGSPTFVLPPAWYLA